MAFPAALLDKLKAKLEAEVFDAGASFMIELIEEDRALKAPWAKRRVVATEDLPAGGDCWLVDHAWTFDPRDARAQLEVHPPLVARLAAMLGIEDNGSEGPTEVGGEQLVNSVLENMWPLTTFDNPMGAHPPPTELSSDNSAGGSNEGIEQEFRKIFTQKPRDDFELRAHVCDELGSALRHGAKNEASGAGPTAALCAVTSPFTGEHFSVFWLLEPLKAGDEVTIDRAAAWTTQVGSGRGGKDAGQEAKAAAASVLLRRAVLLGLGCPESGDVASEEAFFVDMHLAAEAAPSPVSAAAEAGTTPPPGQVFEVSEGQAGQFGASYPLASNSTPLRASPNPAIAAATLGTSNAQNVVKVCSDSAWVREQLTGQGSHNLPLNPRLELTDTPDEAHALWMSMHIAQLPQIYGFKMKPAKNTVLAGSLGLPPGCGFGYGSCQVLNQLPYEACLIRKDHLADTISLWHTKQGGTSSLPPWLPRTYDLTRPQEVASWLGHAIANARLQDIDSSSKSNSSGSSTAHGVDNTSGADSDASPPPPPSDVWVVKPAALARSLGTTVTRSPACVMQLLLLGPQVAQAYLTPPLLYQNRKFDCRFNVLLRVDATTREPTLFAWSDFWVRLADRPYDIKLERLDDVTTHLTAMHLLLKPHHANQGQDGSGESPAESSTEKKHEGGDEEPSSSTGLPKQSVPNPSCAEFESFAAENCPGGAAGWQEVKRQVHALMVTSFLAAFDRCPGMLGTGNTETTSDGSGGDSHGDVASNESDDDDSYPRGAAAIYGFDIMFDTSWQPHLLEVQFDPACKDGFSAAEALGCLLLGEDDGPHLVPLAFD